MVADSTALSTRLAFNGVSFSYPRTTQPALDQVEALFDASTLAVLGPNGAGKTTLFRLLTAVALPSSGSIEFGEFRLGRGLHQEKFRREIGVMPQHLQMFGSYRCADFLRYVCWLRRLPVRRIEAAVSESLRVVHLEQYADRKIKTLSGGMRQRLGLAQAFVADPRLVVLDEPTVGLDPAQRVDFREYLMSLRERCTIVFATHLVDDVAAVAEDVLVLSHGRQLFSGSLSDFAGTTGRHPVSGSAVEAAYLRLVPRDEQ